MLKESDSSDTGERVEAIRGGDRLAFDRLFGRVGSRIYVYLHSRMDERLRRVMDAEDLLQEVYLKAFEAFEEFEDRGRGSLGRWMVGIANNRIRTHLKRLGYEKRDPRREVPLTPPDGDGSSGPRTRLGPATPPSRAVARDEETRRMAHAVAALPEDRRELILLHFYEGRTLAEVAEACGVSKRTASRQLADALARIESSLKNSRIS